MFEGQRRWFRRNRTGIAVGAGLLGAAYLAGQYVIGKITETRQRMSDDRIAREKYAWLKIPQCGAAADGRVVSEGDFAKIKKTARIPYSLYYLRQQRTLYRQYLSKRLYENCRAESLTSGQEHQPGPISLQVRHHRTRKMTTVVSQAQITCMPVKSRRKVGKIQRKGQRQRMYMRRGAKLSFGIS